MGYIRFKIRRSRSDGVGGLETATIGRIESDMELDSLYELPHIMHALSAARWREEDAQGAFTLDTSTLDSAQWLLG